MMEKQFEEMVKIAEDALASPKYEIACSDSPCPYLNNKSVFCDTCIVLNALYNAGYRKQSEWISVEDRLPGVSGRYICAVKDKNGHTWTVAGDYSLEMKKWFGLLFGEIKNQVTHWMPLPEPPEVKGGAE